MEKEAKRFESTEQQIRHSPDMRFSALFLVAVFVASFAALVLAGKDYYTILGVSRDASKDEIRRAYKRLSIKFHPGN